MPRLKVDVELLLRIARAVKENPELSQRQLAARFGVSQPTIAKAVAQQGKVTK